MISMTVRLEFFGYQQKAEVDQRNFIIGNSSYHLQTAFNSHFAHYLIIREKFFNGVSFFKT